MSNMFEIASSKGFYSLEFVSIYSDLQKIVRDDNNKHFYIIDKNVYKFHQDLIEKLTKNAAGILFIEANEANKSYEQLGEVFSALLENSIRRENTLVAIGGGVTQDIVCFVASIFLRGIDWIFLPTTLLAQADSCVGSKSSINFQAKKNIVGTFYPPKKIFIDNRFIKTLSDDDIRSGVGEIIKVHFIAGSKHIDMIIRDYDLLMSDEDFLRKYTEESLRIKKYYVEIDEFDAGVRNIFNYGHSFGHAIESVTNYAIPHGIAVTLGMDIANYYSAHLGMITYEDFIRFHRLMRKNYAGFGISNIDQDKFFDALSADKKNLSDSYVVILFDAVIGTPKKVCLGKGCETKNVLNAYIEEYHIR